MKNARQTLLGLAALALAAAGVAALVRDEPARSTRVASPAVPAHASAAAARGGFRLVPGAVRRYSLELETETTVQGAPGSSPERTRLALDGALAWTGLAASARGTTARLSVEGEVRLEVQGRTLVATRDSRLRQDLARGGEVDLSPEGTVLGFRGALERGTVADRVFRAVLGATEVAVPPGSAASWTAREEAPEGVFEARYTASGEPARLAIEKTRAVRSLASPLLRGETRGSFAARFDDREGALLGLEGEESLASRLEGREVATSRTRVRLTLVERAVAAVVAPVAAPGAPLRPLLEARSRDRREVDRRLAGRETVAGLLGALSEGGDARDAAVARLAALVRLDPTAAAQVAAAVLGLASGDRTAALLVAALGAAGSKPAEDALVSVVLARRQDKATLLQAIAALGRLDEPSPAAEALLRDLHGDASLPRTTTDAALLALGSVASKLADASPARAAALVAGIADELARDPRSASVALLALGNAGGEGVLGTLQPYLGPEQPTAVRVRATRSLRNVPGARAEAILVTLLGDLEDGVRREAAGLLASRAPSAAAAPGLCLALATDADERVRRDSLRALGGLAGEPGVRDAIVAASTGDASEGNRGLAAGLLARLTP